MPSSEDLLAKLERWEAGFPSPPTLKDALASRDVEILAAFVLRGLREAAKEAVGDRLELEQNKLVGVKLGRHGAAGRVADGLARIWRLDEPHELALLGFADPESLQALRDMLPEKAGHDVLERLAMLLDIYYALHTLLPEAEAADTWISRPNEVPLLGGRSALEFMSKEGLSGIRSVRAYLWSQVY